MILYGAGGHAKVIYDCLISQGIDLSAVFDDNASIQSFFYKSVSNSYNPECFRNDQVIISIGSNKSREKISRIVQHEFGIIVHRQAFVSNSAEMGNGSMIVAKSIIQSCATIGKHAIINSGAVIEHDSNVEDFVHVGPGAVVCGSAKIGKGAFIGANATILPGISIGKWAIIGAGSVVLRDVAAGSIIAGNPAKKVK